jgi:hypothetical protein
VTWRWIRTKVDPRWNVVQEELVEIRNDAELPHTAGDMVVGSKRPSRWWENRRTARPIDVSQAAIEPGLSAVVGLKRPSAASHQY